MRGGQPTSVSVRPRPLQGPVQVHVSERVKHMRYSFKVMHDEVPTVKVRISPAWALARAASLRELECLALPDKETSLV